MSIQTEIARLNTAKSNILTSIRNKGVDTSGVSTLSDVSTLIDSIETGSGGSSTPTKGFLIESWDDSGYPTEVTIKGFATIPNYLCYYIGYKGSSSNASIFHKAKINIIGNITSIGSYAFYYCTNITFPTTLPDTITSIDSYAFQNCGNLRLTKLPDALTNIGKSAFRACPYLNITRIPDGVTIIEENAFYQCSSMALSELPSGLTKIQPYGFYNCVEATFPSIPSGVTTITNYSFKYCEALEDLVIEGAITTVGTQAFYGCLKLKHLRLPNVTKAPSLTANAFQNTPIASGTGYIYVPDSLVDSFKSATNWSTYANQIVAISTYTGNDVGGGGSVSGGGAN